MISNGVKSLLHSPSEQSELAEIMFSSDCVSMCAHCAVNRSIRQLQR